MAAYRCDGVAAARGDRRPVPQIVQRGASDITDLQACWTAP